MGLGDVYKRQVLGTSSWRGPDCRCPHRRGCAGCRTCVGLVGPVVDVSARRRVDLLLRHLHCASTDGSGLDRHRGKIDVHSAHVAADPVATVKQLATVGAGTTTAALPRNPVQAMPPMVHEHDNAWHIAKSPVAFAGAALMVLSYVFDGHTVSEGPRLLHAVANSVHVVTAATWAGGVVMLALVIARRHRRNADTRALQLAVRFSVVATVALVGAAIAGVALSIVILDSVSEIWTTSWGQLLILKTVLVGVAAAGGGYNHRIVIPALERAPDDVETAHRFRSIVTLEAVALVAVTIVTALLIAASAS